VVACRPLAETGAKRPRPPRYWPADVALLAEALLMRGRYSR
jgi:ADP-ribosyl-[dinitrogen reductase] hydrolase